MNILRTNPRRVLFLAISTLGALVMIAAAPPAEITKAIGLLQRAETNL